VLNVASLPGKYAPPSIDRTSTGKICLKSGRPKRVRERRSVRGLGDQCCVGEEYLLVLLPYAGDVSDNDGIGTTGSSSLVDGNVLHCVDIHLLREVDLTGSVPYTRARMRTWATYRYPQESRVCLRRLDLLEQRLEPPKRPCIATGPDELDPPQGTEAAGALGVPDVLENAREGLERHLSGGDAIILHLP
jgi:hypothetical protein